MVTRRTMVLALLAGVFFAALASVLSVIGVANWWLKAIVAAGGGIALFAVGIAQTRASAAIDQDERRKVELTRSIFTPAGKPPLVRAITNPVSVGVHRAARPGGTAWVPPYITRDTDPALHQALAASGFVLLAGDAAAGKTRTAYEAMRVILPDHVLIAPAGTGDVTAALSAARAAPDSVLWLDNLQRYLGVGALGSTQVAELLAGEHHRVVLATLRTTEETRLLDMAEMSPGGQLMQDGRAVLDQVTHRIVVNRLFSVPERMRAADLARDDRRLADALWHADRYGIAEYLSEGPQLHIEWLDGWERGTHPRGAALVATAVDCRRAGYAGPLPQVLLEELQEHYLAGRGGTQLHPEPLAAAWAWATKLRHSGNSPLWGTDRDGYDVFDYLVDMAEREPQPVPEQTVLAALRHARPGDAMNIAATAWYQGRPELAEAGFRRAFTELRDEEGPDALTTLSSRSDLAVILHATGKLPDAETEYRAILAARTVALGASQPDTLSSRNNLAVVLHAQRRLTAAEAEYRDVLDIRVRTLGRTHPDTLTSRNNLGVVLRDLGQLEEAESQLEETARLRAQMLGARHPYTVFSQENLASVRRRRAGP